MRGFTISCLLIAGLAFDARAGVTISKRPTHDMNCNGGTCVSTAKDANLNVGDLAAMLGAGDVTVTGKDIALDAALSWASTHALSLDATHDIVIAKPLVVAGAGGLSLAAGDDLDFIERGHAELWDDADRLTINGDRYALVSSFEALQTRTDGFVALAKSIRAPRTVFASAPMPTFDGTLEGLGNTVSRLKVDDETSHAPVGMIGALNGTVRDIALTDADMRGMGAEKITGALVGDNFGRILHASASGRVFASGSASYAGGLAGRNDGGSVLTSHSDTVVTASGTDFVEGGLVGFSSGTASNTYWDLDTSGVSDPSQGAGNVINDPGITGLTTTEFQSGLPPGFDNKVWAEKPGANGGFPYLR